jgi:hypothetical protein
MVVVDKCGAGRNLFLLRTLRRLVEAVVGMGRSKEAFGTLFEGVSLFH